MYIFVKNKGYTKMFNYTDGTQKDLDLIQQAAELNNCKILQSLRERNKSTNQTPLSFRIINSWTSSGILDDERKKPQGWRKFSTMDIILMTILIELRKFGLSIEKLKQVKNSLYLPAQESNNPNAITRLEFALLRSKTSIEDGNTYLLIDSNGNTGVITERDIALNRTTNNIPASYIYINFNKVEKEILKDKTMQIWDEDTFWLYNSEWNLIKNIRLADDKREITVKTNKNRINLVEKSFASKPKDTESLHNLINKIGYGQINLTIKDGKVSYLQGKTQKKNKAITD